MIFKGKFVSTKLFIKRAYFRLKYIFFREKLPKNLDGKVYVNLGCGPSSSDEFINVDAVPQEKTHHIANIQELFMFTDNSVDLLYASHVIEHLPRTELLQTLCEWRRKLKPGGVLRFGVPDFDSLIEIYKQSNRDVESIVNQLMGQDGVYDDHHTIWNKEFAEKIMKEAGFSSVRGWNPESVEHHKFTDKTSRKYEIGGKMIPISLNLEAVN